MFNEVLEINTSYDAFTNIQNGNIDIVLSAASNIQHSTILQMIVSKILFAVMGEFYLESYFFLFLGITLLQWWSALSVTQGSVTRNGCTQLRKRATKKIKNPRNSDLEQLENYRQIYWKIVILGISRKIIIHILIKSPPGSSGLQLYA